MDQLLQLSQTLLLARRMLDNAASQIRDAALSPTREHIESIGHALVHVFDIENAIYKVRPELEPKYEEESEETKAANRRLGEALIAAYDLADLGQVLEATQLLAEFSKSEQSELHREHARNEEQRILRNYGDA